MRGTVVLNELNSRDHQEIALASNTLPFILEKFFFSTERNLLKNVDASISIHIQVVKYYTDFRIITILCMAYFKVMYLRGS